MFSIWDDMILCTENSEEPTQAHTYTHTHKHTHTSMRIIKKFDQVAKVVITIITLVLQIKKVRFREQSWLMQVESSRTRI